MLDARQAVVFENELRVRAALRELHLTPALLENALRTGLGAAALCTANHPPRFPGNRDVGRDYRIVGGAADPGGLAPRR